VLNYSWRDYGNRVGVWRCLELFDQLSVPVGCLISTALYDYCPEVVQAFVDRARRDHRPRATPMPSARRRCRRWMSAHCWPDAASGSPVSRGRAPTGWLSPWISESVHTPDLLAETGYAYTLNWCHDDQPIEFATRGGQRLWSIPDRRNSTTSR
jgi:hypothetical protein